MNELYLITFEPRLLAQLGSGVKTPSIKRALQCLHVPFTA